MTAIGAAARSMGLVQDLIAQDNPVILLAEQADPPIDRRPARCLGMREVLRRPAYLPDSLIWLRPAMPHKLDQLLEHLLVLGRDLATQRAKAVYAFHHVSIKIGLPLVVRAVACPLTGSPCSRSGDRAVVR